MGGGKETDEGEEDDEQQITVIGLHERGKMR